LTKKLQLDTSAFYTSALPEVNVPSHIRLDVRVGWRLTEKVELSVGVRDALEAQHIEMFSHRLNGLEAVQRNGYGKMTWRF
jgi:hypothetical protein